MKNGSVVWYCKRTSEENAKIETFAKPEKFTLRFHFLTIQPASGYNSVVEFGENTSKTWTGMAQPYHKWFGVLKEGDRWYIDGAEPEIPSDGSEPEDGWGYDANARITSVRPQNLAVRFILQRIQ